MRTKYGGIWEAAFVLLLVLFAAVSFAQPGGTGGGKRYNIHGKPVDRRAIENLLDDSLEDGEVEMQLDDKTIKKLRGRFKIDMNKPVEEAALDFIDRHRNAFGLKNPKEELKAEKPEPYGADYQQVYNGVPVWQHSLGVFLDKDHNIRMILGNLTLTPDINTVPLLTREEALEKVEADLNRSVGGKAKPRGFSEPQILLTILTRDKWPPRDLKVIMEEMKMGKKMAEDAKLTYWVLIGMSNPYGDWEYFIDAKTGKVITKNDIMMYDAVPGKGIMFNNRTAFLIN